MSEIPNNENIQIAVEDNNQNLINNNQFNVEIPQNPETNIPMINEPFMDPEANRGLSNPQRPINMNENKHSLSCLILVCFGVCIGTFAVSCGCCIFFAWLLILYIDANGGLAED